MTWRNGKKILISGLVGVGTFRLLGFGAQGPPPGDG